MRDLLNCTGETKFISNQPVFQTDIYAQKNDITKCNFRSVPTLAYCFIHKFHYFCEAKSLVNLFQAPTYRNLFTNEGLFFTRDLRLC